MRMTDKQMMAPMSEKAFSDWYVDDIMRAYLTDFFEDLGPNVCRAFTINGMCYAKHFGFERPDLQGQFVTLMWDVAPNFFMFAEMKPILDADLSDVDKIDALYDTIQSLSDTYTDRIDQRYWYPELVEDNILGVPFEREETL